MFDKEIIFRCYQQLCVSLFELRRFDECKEYCNNALEATSTMEEKMFTRHFELIMARCSIQEGNSEDALQALEALTQQSNCGFDELDDCFIATCLIEMGWILEQSNSDDMSNNWKLFLNPTEVLQDSNQKATSFEHRYRQAETLLEKQLYNSGFFLNPSSEVQTAKKYLRQEELILLVKLKTKLATLLLMRGETEDAGTVLQTCIKALDQCALSPPRLVSVINFLLGRISRQLINAPLSIEKLWGSKQISAQSWTDAYVSQNLLKADLSFLSPFKHLEKVVTLEFTQSYYDTSLLKRALMEMVYLYGCKSVKDDETTLLHTIICSQMLVSTCKLSRMAVKLLRNYENMIKDCDSVKTRPPTFACEEIEIQFKKRNRFQASFVAQQAAKQLVPDPKQKKDAQKKTDADVCTKSRNVILYYLSLLQEYESACITNNTMEQKLVQMHKYLVKEFPPYASEYLLASPPSIKDTSTLEHGMVCSQLYIVDNGHAQFSKATQDVTDPLELLKLQQKKEEQVSIPFVSLFYCLYLAPVQSGSKSSNQQANQQQQQPSEKPLPVLGVLRFEQHVLSKLLFMFKELLWKLDKSSVTVLPTSDDIRKAASSTNKKSKNDAYSEQQVELTVEKDKLVAQLVDTLRKPINAQQIINPANLTADESMHGIPLTRTQLEGLCDFLDPNVGLLLVDEALCKWLKQILGVFH